MYNKKKRDDFIDNLAEAYRQQRPTSPSKNWSSRVMDAVRSETPVNRQTSVQLRMIWRTAAVAAAAAAIFLIASVWSLHSDARLAWELHQDQVIISLVTQTGE